MHSTVKGVALAFLGSDVVVSVEHVMSFLLAFSAA